MRYLVKARVKTGQEAALFPAIEDGPLGKGSVAGDEYLHNMQEAHVTFIRQETGTVDLAGLGVRETK